MSGYITQFKGNFKSTLRWHDLDAFWKILNDMNHGQWFIYHIGDEPPKQASDAATLHQFIVEIDQFLKSEHEEDYCGIVYADNLLEPSIVKIYDPNNLGVSCGFSDNPPLPGWTLSLAPPEDLPRALPPPTNTKRWWRKLFRPELTARIDG